MSQVRAEAGLEGGETQTKYTESPALRVLTTPSFSRGASTVGGPSGATETTTNMVTLRKLSRYQSPSERSENKMNQFSNNKRES